MFGYVTQGLSGAFPGQEPTIPLNVLAGSITGVFGAAMISWRTVGRDIAVADMASHVHRQMRALVREAYAPGV